MAKHNETGAKGELIAANFLTGKGYTIVARNWRYGHKEVDLVMTYEGWLIFGEVKTRHGIGYGYPEEAITKGKQQFLKKAAAAYFEQFPGYEKVRFDVVAIVLDNSGEVVELLHLEDSF